MFQPLYVAATGLNAAESELLEITNNVANAKTPGFKAGKTEMENLPYIQKSFKDVLDEKMAAYDSSSNIIPEFVTGVRVAATPKDFSQGTLETTSNPLDIAIQGEGFFQVEMPDGSTAYTRAGHFRVDNEGNLVDANGHFVQPSIVLPEGTTSIVIRPDGTVLVSLNNEKNQTEIGQINLAKFSNPVGLTSLGQNLFASSPSSGEPIFGFAGESGYGTINQYAIESSNVDVISEMMHMVMVQRVFETITKAVSGYENMLTALERMKA